MRYLAVITISFSLLILSNCGSDEDELVEIPDDISSLLTLSSYYLSEDAAGFIVVADTSGNILAKATIQSNVAMDLRPESGYDKESINVYLIIKSNGFYHTQAYLNIKRGSTWDFKGQSVNGVRNPIRMKVMNCAKFDHLSFGTNYFGRTYHNSSLSDTLGYGTSYNYLDGGKVYAQIVNDDQGKYRFIDIQDGLNIYDIDFSALTGISLKKNITVPANLGGNFSINGLENKQDISSTYFLFERPIEGTSFSIYYPDVVFSNYHTMLSVKIGNTKTFHYWRTGDIVFQYDPLNFDATIINANPGNFKMDFHGTFDYFKLEMADPTRKKFIHVFGSHKTSSFVIPDLSGILPVEKLNFSEFTLKHMGLFDMDDFTEENAYSEYYSTIPLKSMPSTKAVIHNF